MEKKITKKKETKKTWTNKEYQELMERVKKAEEAVSNLSSDLRTHQVFGTHTRRITTAIAD